MIQVIASIHRMSLDREGETTLTLKIPKVDINKMGQLSLLTERALLVTIAEPNQ